MREHTASGGAVIEDSQLLTTPQKDRAGIQAAQPKPVNSDCLANKKKGSNKEYYRLLS